MKKLLKPPMLATTAKNSMSLHAIFATAHGGQAAGAHDNR